MHVESSPAVVPWERLQFVSGRGFVRAAIASAAMLLVIVATGATVRLTSSGLGCRHWPGCQAGHPFPEKGYHSYVEFSNRLVAALTIVVVLVAAIASLLTARLPWRTRGLAFAAFVGTAAQAPLGAITVYYDLNPWLVLSHLLLSLGVLALGVLVALDSLAFVRGLAAARAPAPVRWGGLALLAALCALVVTGTVVTASGPHSGDRDVARLAYFGTAIWLHVRATAVFGLLFLGGLAWAWRERRRLPLYLPSALVLLGLLVAQMVVGETQYRTQLPWWLVLVHVTLAASVWAAGVALVRLLWRPARITRNA